MHNTKRFFTDQIQEANLETLPNAEAHPDTKSWWEKNPEALAAYRQDCQQPELAIKGYVLWLKQLPGKPVFVDYPAIPLTGIT